MYGISHKLNQIPYNRLVCVIGGYLLLLLSFVHADAQEGSTDVSQAVDSSGCQHYFDLGVSYLFPVDRRKGPDYDSATMLFEKKISCDPQLLSSYVYAAACYMKIANYARSRELLFTVLELRPNFLQARLLLAHYYREVDSSVDAKVQDSLVSELIKPLKGEKRTDRFKRYGQVIMELRRVKSLGIENAGLHLSWGKALMQFLDPGAPRAKNDKKIEEAVVEFRRAIAMEINNPQAHLWLAHALSLSRIDGAPGYGKEPCREYRRVLKLDPENEEARKGLKRLGCVWEDD